MFNTSDPVVTESLVPKSYSAAAVQLFVEVEAAELWLLADNVPYEPLPEAGLVQQKVSQVAAVEGAADAPETAGRPIANEVDGAEVTRATTRTVSVFAVPVGRVKLTVIALVSPARRPVVLLNEIAVGETNAAPAGTTEVNMLRPKAETTTSAKRLRFVFIDICFLS